MRASPVKSVRCAIYTRVSRFVGEREDSSLGIPGKRRHSLLGSARV